MTCDCCERNLPSARFACTGWCEDCCAGDCTPGGRRGRQCPVKRASHLGDLATLGLTILSARCRGAVRWVAVLALLGLGLAVSEPSPRWWPTQQDRAFTAARLENLALYVGFPARFHAEGTTLVMLGSELCGEEFLSSLPAPEQRDVRDVRFERFRCEGGGVRVDVSLRGGL